MEKEIDKSMYLGYPFTKKQKEILRKAASVLGGIKSKKKAASSRKNGKLGGYWKNFK